MLVTLASPGGDKGSTQLNRPTGQKMEGQEGLVAGNPGDEAPIAELEYQP